MANLQLAIDNAAPEDTIFVEGGTYTGTGNINLNFGGRNIVVWGEDGAAATIIDCEGSAMENARGFIFESGEPHTAVVSGLTIRNGYRSGTTWPNGYGGGILIRNAGTRPTIKNCIFENNTAEGRGGGIAVGDDAAPSVVFCEFANNTGEAGGGGACASSDLTVVECEFIGNRAPQGSGGGLRLDSRSSSRVRDSVIRYNSARDGGGMLVYVASAIVAQCMFVGNTATATRGGGVHANEESDLLLSKCLFVGNTASFAEGGAVCCQESVVEMTGCTLHRNLAPVGAGVYLMHAATLQAENTIISRSREGEAVACDLWGGATLNCCDLFGNEGGDWVGCIEDQAGRSDNMSADPLFCNVDDGDFHLAETSPCAEEHAGACGLIGRYGVECASAVEEATWGGVKALYRR
jgi:predicted outer membrane repeat protein